MGRADAGEVPLARVPAAMDRVVQHAAILELDVPSYRAEAAGRRLGTNQERGD